MGRFGKLGPGWVEPVQKYGSWVWLRQIRSGPSDEAGGPDLIMKQFITAVEKNNLTVQKNLNKKRKIKSTATVRSTIWRLTQGAYNNKGREQYTGKITGKTRSHQIYDLTVPTKQVYDNRNEETHMIKQDHHRPLDLRSNGLDLEGLPIHPKSMCMGAYKKEGTINSKPNKKTT